MINTVEELKKHLTHADTLAYWSTDGNTAILNGQKIILPINENEIERK